MDGMGFDYDLAVIGGGFGVVEWVILIRSPQDAYGVQGEFGADVRR